MFEKVLAMYERGTRSDGDPLYVFEAIEWCSEFNKPIPQWLGEAFSARLWLFTSFQVRTLDEAFRVSRPKSFKLTAARQEFEKLQDAMERFEHLRSNGTSAEEARQLIAKELNISAALVKKYQAKWTKRFSPLPDQVPSALGRISMAVASAIAPAAKPLRKSKKRS